MKKGGWHKKAMQKRERNDLISLGSPITHDYVGGRVCATRLSPRLSASSTVIDSFIRSFRHQEDDLGPGEGKDA